MARRRGMALEVPHADERWLITYADMITLLLAVFIVMYALSDTNLKKFEQFATSVAAAFDPQVFTGAGRFTITEAEASGVGHGDAAADFRAVRGSIRDYAIGHGLDAAVSVDQVPEGISIRINSALLFTSGRAALSDDSVVLLAQIARVVGGLPNDIRVEGHTDDRRPDGFLYRDNWQLSSARALAVLHHLEAAGIAGGRLSSAGYAEHRPIDAGTSEEARARNRRVDIVLLYPRPDDAAPASPDGGPAPFGPLPFEIP